MNNGSSAVSVKIADYITAVTLSISRAGYKFVTVIILPCYVVFSFLLVQIHFFGKYYEVNFYLCTLIGK